MKAYYIGIFPPKYGGVTIKNDNLYNALKNYIEIDKIDLNKVKRGNLIEIVRLLIALTNRNSKFMIGVAGQRRNFTRLLLLLNKKSMCRSVIFIMGGLAAKEIAKDAKYTSDMSYYKTIFVETEGMKVELENVGLSNVEIYPNARFRSCITFNSQKTVSVPPRCLFFSLIDKAKGADIVLDVASQLTDVEFHFYGQISEEYYHNFMDRMRGLNNVFYHGVFKGNPDEVYTELNKYDLLLLPTRWKAEGVPGVLVESKIACLPAIVSDINYNSEIVCHGKDGIVLEKNDSAHLEAAIRYLLSNQDFLIKMKENCKETAEQYYIDTYVESIISNF